MKSFLFTLLLLSGVARSEVIQTDLLIVGGNESACAAAVQAARLGVKKIVLVNDIQWLGGQFSAEGVGCLDEWTTVGGKRVNFPRSGLFAEVVQRIRAHNSATYGKATPGNAYCGTDTIEPAAAAGIFEDLLRPYVESGVLRIERDWEPVKVSVIDGKVTGVDFQHTQGKPESLTVNARLTMDASDWGDVIRLSGARYGAGPDLRSRFHEPSAPEAYDEAGRQEMNPLSWCVVLREAGKASVIPPPATYDARSFAAVDKTRPWVDSDMSAGIYASSGWSIYTHRRLVDRWHNGFAPGTEATFLNWPVQDYPLCQLPQPVVEALEKTEVGASKKNIVDLTPAQRRIIFTDAKAHALSFLHHLQTKVHERVGDFPQSFRYMELTDEFGTPDRLPPKPYIREGLRLEALAMLNENHIRADSKEPKWANVLAVDSILGFQFNIDFHPTRRKFLTEDRNGPWQYVHTESRGWHTDTDRATFPLRGLVPVEMNGLLGAGKNIGVSSVVQSALRLHNQMMLIGQASATLAWMSLREESQPRQVVASMPLVRELQQKLVRGHGGPGVLIFPWQDVLPEDAHFEAANLLAVRLIWLPETDSVFFQPTKIVTRRELAGILARLYRATRQPKDQFQRKDANFLDVPAADTDRADIKALVSLDEGGPQKASLDPDGKVTWSTLHRWLTALGLPASPGLLDKDRGAHLLTRAECAQHLWRALSLSEEWFPDTSPAADPEDMLPFDQENDNVPDRLQPPR
ncbi:FAD dependent oxidoreductase [Prosthecobacter fusiformis]|uniref:FAD dependent oxidoreductase n=1 Tax=Prosthecobacter fusiformis TaxID=48464 RepID=A0A4R7RZ55_9BACT|nr:FAD-dependent oxidoreductase [Prosthecobacter fusiformis]TDU71234.1 FAD dependent oxidoreductase [Prosthecobacter fusiformis]